MTRAGRELLQGAREALAIARGEIAPARVHVPPTVSATRAREKLGLSPDAFARLLGVSLETLAEWERGESVMPEGAARTLLMVIERDPEAVQKALWRA